jgi:hypothetical protein
MQSIRRRALAVVIATGAVALAAPVSGASAQLAVGGNQIGTAGCVGTNRPSAGGNNGSTSAQACGALYSFSGSHIGQINGGAPAAGPTVIGSPFTEVYVSAGSITEVGP